MELINSEGKEYQLVIEYGKNDELRKKLNDLTRKTFAFDFEQWYQDGYWKYRYIPYSLIYVDMSVNIMDLNVFGNEKRYIQLGTVMTDADYRKHGLARLLMDKVIADYEDKCDLIYLFANNSVLDFYPKFGFEKIDQYQYTRKSNTIQIDMSIKKLDVFDENDRNLIIEKVIHAVPISKVSMCGNAELIMFYCTPFMKNNIYYVKDYDAVVIADFTEGKMNVFDIFCTENIPLNELLDAFTNDTIENMVLFFTPLDVSLFEMIAIDDDDTLFAIGEDKKLLENNQFMFSKLSHT